MNNFDGLLIPKDIFNNHKLTFLEKVYLSVLEANIKFKNTREFADFINIDIETLNFIRGNLIDKGYLKIKDKM